jgi:hypothetical protein
MTFNVSLSQGLPLVRPGTVARILFACFALIAASSGTEAQTPTASPSASPTGSPASVSPAASAPTPAEASAVTDPKTAGASRTVVVPPEKAQPVRIPKLTKPPVIDGKLDDEVWKEAAVLKDFYQIDPGDNIAPSKPTEVLIGYDEKFFYVAFRAFDEPDKVRSTVAKRDNIFQDDYVGFFLDTFNDQRRAFEFFFNPLGIQGDGILTEGRGEDFSVDVLFDSKGVIHETGYNVEIAIPFKSIRYVAGKDKQWGVHFFRRIQRFNRELSSWMPLSRSISGNMNQAGHITGLEGISTERTLELVPSVTLSQDGRFVRSFGVFPNTPAALTDPGRIVNEHLRFDPGLTLKFVPSPAITLDLAINPDFAQVEADQLVVTANQRFPIFFPEKRPFFLEGIDIFQTRVTAVHTRAIVDPDIAVKTTGKIGRNSFGLILASDNGPGNLSADQRGALSSCIERRSLDPQVVCNDERFVDKNAYIGVLRLKRDIGKENTIGMLATSYNFIEKHNQLLAIDGRFKLDKQTVFAFQTLGTTSRNFFFDPDDGITRYRTGNGFGYSTVYSVSGRHWGYELGGEGFTQDYRADVGFFQRPNSNFNFGFLRYNSDRNPKKKLVSFHIHNFTHINYDWQGRMYSIESEQMFELSLPRSSWFGMFWEPAWERLFDHEFGATREARPCNPFGGNSATRCTFYGPDNERSSMKHHLSAFFGSNFNKKVQFNGQVTHRWGHFDLDFGNLPKYPRVSPPAILARELAASGQCNPPAAGQPDLRSPLCFGVPLDPGRGNLLQISGGITYQPTNAFRTSLSLNKQRLVRDDTGRVAFDVNILTWRGTYQFTKAWFARAIVDYNTLNSRTRSQFLLGWTPSPGKSFYAGYNDDLNYNSAHPFSSQLVPGFRRNSRTFFVKMSWLFRKSF